METIKIDPQKLCGYSKYLWEKAFNEGYKEGYKIGFEKGYKIGLKRAYNKCLERLQLTIYTNMKNDNWDDAFIRSVLGVSTRKFQEIQRLFNESTAGTKRPLT